MQVLSEVHTSEKIKVKHIDKQLFDAAIKGHLHIVQERIKAGTDVSASDNWALRWSAFYGRLEVVRELIKAGADVHADNDGALRYAVRNGELNVVQELLKAGANPKAVPKFKELLLKGLK